MEHDTEFPHMGISDTAAVWDAQSDELLIQYVQGELGRRMQEYGLLPDRLRVLSTESDRRLVIDHPTIQKPCVLYLDSQQASKPPTFAAVAREVRRKFRSIAIDSAEQDGTDINSMREEEMPEYIARAIRVRLLQQQGWDQEPLDPKRKKPSREKPRSALQKLRSYDDFVTRRRADERDVFLVPTIPLSDVSDWVSDLARRQGFCDCDIEEVNAIAMANPDKVRPQSLGKEAAKARRTIAELAAKRGFAAVWSSPHEKDRWTIHVFAPKAECMSIEHDIRSALWPDGAAPDYIRIITHNQRLPHSADPHGEREWAVQSRGKCITITDNENVSLTLSYIENLHERFPQSTVFLRLDTKDVKEDGFLLIEIYTSERRQDSQSSSIV